MGRGAQKTSAYVTQKGDLQPCYSLCPWSWEGVRGYSRRELCAMHPWLSPRRPTRRRRPSSSYVVVRHPREGKRGISPGKSSFVCPSLSCRLFPSSTTRRGYITSLSLGVIKDAFPVSHPYPPCITSSPPSPAEKVMLCASFPFPALSVGPPPLLLSPSRSLSGNVHARKRPLLIFPFSRTLT